MEPLEGLTPSHVALAETVKERPATVEESAMVCAAGTTPAAVEKLRVVGETWKAAGTASTSRIRLLPVSAMYRLPAGSTATPPGSLSAAPMAGPPSPQNPVYPFPATVMIVPPDTLRIAVSNVSAM